jgi:hypothetical protein
MSDEPTAKPPTEPEHVARGLAVEAGHVAQGQRRINLIWEITQAFVAVAVTMVTLYVSANLTLTEKGDQAAALLLSNAFFLVIGFYFGRTNHQRVGGVGPIDGR